MIGPGAMTAKRLVDLILASVALVALSPVILIVALAVRVRLGTPVLFRQRRPGRDQRSFELLKFRSMSEGDEDDAERLTVFGAKLRSTSLDELPELWNIVRGDMSLVGPRPLLSEYLPLYTDRQARRQLVRPGLTGLAQVSGRNSLSWEDRLELDVRYVDHYSVWLDARILLETVRTVISREGVAEAEGATMSRFTGSNDRQRQ